MTRDYIAEALRATVALLEAERIPWVVSGSVALAFHGVLRATHDVDFKVRVTRSGGDLERLRDAMRPGPFRALDETTYRYAEAVDVELYPLDGTIDADAFRYRQRVHLLPDDADLYWVVAPEDLILSKVREYVRWKDYKHIDDVKKLLVATRAGLDAARIRSGLEGHEGFQEAWDALVEPGPRDSG